MNDEQGTGFLNLPRDIHEIILNDNLSNQSLYLSKYFTELMAKNLCDKPISLAELRQYIEDEKPKIFLLVVTNADYYSYQIYNIIFDKPNEYDVSYYELAFFTDAAKFNTNKTDAIYMLNNYRRDKNFIADIGREHGASELSPDILTMYRIRRKRLSCMKQNPLYAKTYVKNYFTSLIKTFHEKINKDSKLLLDFYYLLLLESYVLNIPGNIPINIDNLYFDVDQNDNVLPDNYNKPIIQEIQRLIPILIQEINKRIDMVELL